MNADIKVICPECSAEFVSCNEYGVNLFAVNEKYLRCPEPFNCNLSGFVYKKPPFIKLEKIEPNNMEDV